MNVTVRKGVTSDLPAVLELIKELAEFEQSLHEVSVSLKDLQEDGFGKHPYFWFLVAQHQSEIIGMSFYFIRYSSWKGRFLFLEDFVVKEPYRNKGIGSMLFEETIRQAQLLNVKGMIWQVLDWNHDAIRFYKKYQADISSNWYNGKLNHEQIKNFKFQ